MRRVSYPWLALISLSCATAESPDRLGGLDTEGGSMSGGVGATVTGGTDAVGGVVNAGGGGTPGNFGGNVTSGGNVDTGGGGTFGVAGTFGMAGTFGQLGGMGGVAAGAGGMGGSGGTGGKNTGGNGGSGGKATGGTGGSAGTGGGGAGGVAKCGDHAILAKASWVGSASAECAPTCADPNGPFTAALAIDGSNTTRYSSGKTQSGDEWLQIDLGGTATVNSVSINSVSATDYTRHYQVRVSLTAVDKAAAVLAEGDGMTGNVVVPLNKTVNGRYVLISQTGAVAVGQTSWWSINEIAVTCQ
jgi:F5/8 type C domain